jgi:hypothetical protein
MRRDPLPKQCASLRRHPRHPGTPAAQGGSHAGDYFSPAILPLAIRDESSQPPPSARMRSTLAVS